MTDITELAHREKFEEWWERTQHNGNPPRFGWSRWRDGEGYKVDDDNSELDGMWSAWKAAVDELVEAQEKAQAENTAGVAGMAESYETTISMLRSRIAELESRAVKPPDELSGEVLLDNDSDVVYSDDAGVLEYTNINGCFVKITAPPDKVIRFRCRNEGTYIRLVDRVKTHEHAGIIIDIPKNYKDFIQ
ncbi:hypothetical protein [Klebsiella pneumoniae]|uniref:hypothetical protein n=1 Tax=Klebsiella pneumoniae TaxID=573 RepID=UPI00249E680F|nr:hypothetical protein [Klebsiella pneumoniae]WGY16124.1 hypothetical protein QJQ34_14145 [Klebsiella pneumoniae]